MAENIENKVGLQGCYWKENDKLFSVSKGGTFILYTNNNNEFSVDERCVGGKTKNPKETVSKARWAFIYEFFFQKLEKAKQEDISENLWGPFSGGTDNVAKYGLGTKYKQGSKIIFKPESYSYYYGYKQRVELFTESPGTGFYFYIIPVDKPQISFAYFTKSEEVKRYGENVSLQIMLHAYNLDKKNKYKAKLYLLEEDIAKGLKETDDFEDNNLWKEPRVYNIANGVSGDNWNSYINLNFPIDIEWKKNQLTKKNFTVVIEVYKYWEEPGVIYGTNQKEERVNYKNYADDPTTDLVQYDPEILGLKDIDNKKSISSRFIVSEELMDHYLERIEQEKNNMIQYIGDVEYQKREFDPCGYSKITLKDEDDKDRASFVIFDETAAIGAIDKTKQSFAIITGDTRKNISITLDQLTTQDAFCQGLLLDQGQKHSEKKNVFQVDKVYAALKNGNDHVRRTDATHQEQQKNAGVATTKENENDTDVVKTNSSYNAGVAQQWREGVDYKIDSNEKITLMLKYVYNKTAFESVQAYANSKYANEAVNSLWTLKYFILSSGNSQTYFLPVSTCRYPNQIASVKIFPDIEWELAALIAVPLWKKTTFKFQATRENLRGYHGQFGFKYVRKELSVEAETEGKVGADFTLKASTSGKDYEAGYKIEKSIKKVIGTFNAVYEKSEIFDGTNEDVTQSAAYKKGVLKKFDFTIDPPNVAIALKWKHEVAKKAEYLGQVGWRIEGGVALKPFIAFGITVDLVPIVGKFGWIGKAVELIIKALEYTVKGLDIFFNFVFTAEVAGSISIGYHNLDGWDEKLKREFTITVNASLEAGVNYEGTALISTIVRDGITYETQEELKIKASLGAGVEYKEEWDSDKKGMFKNVTVTFLGAEAKLEVYSSITRRKKTVYNNDEVVSNQKGDVKHNNVHKLLEKDIWYGPEKIYTDDEKDSK